ncbi:chromate transporter [uncultured Murdochiella sp.]|uniref:chromate transporter n=1 Tax=uncultured Murdochiella sp. TaxID=1586095 RepID=UPI00280618EF|nr:chromate transporter [uncultured Murdochiella sp.]
MTKQKPFPLKQGKQNKQTEHNTSTPTETLSLWALFSTFFKINLFTFGGGYTIVPVIRDEFVQKRGLIEEEEMLDLTALAQSGPGPMAVNTSILTGYRLCGPLGAAVALLAATLPCLLVITLLFYVYQSLRTNPWVNAAFSVMGGAISAILLLTTWNMGKVALRKHPAFGSGILLGAFISGFFLHLNAALIIAVSGTFSLLLFSFVEESRIR